MSGYEASPDGTDAYHPEHPWEQVGHHLYVYPWNRTKANWPPSAARAVGPSEREEWEALPDA
jgi:hypothetical protein